MRIAIDVAQTCVARAGCAWHADSLARAIVRLAGPESVALYHHFGRWTNLAPEMGTRIEGVAMPLESLRRPEAIPMWQSIESGETPLPFSPQIVHSNSFMAPKTPGAKLVYTVHDLCFWTHPDFGTSLNRMICQEQFLLALQRAAGFHFISQTSRDDFERLLPGWLDETKRPWIMARSGLRIGPKEKPDPAKRFRSKESPWLFVGTIEPRKNVDALLDAYERYCAASQLKRPLHIVGREGWFSRDTVSRIEGLGQTLPIRYLGPISDDELVMAYEQAFATAQPSHYEGFGLTTLEGLSFALPTLANPTPAAREFASDALVLTDFASAHSVASEMIRLETQEDRYRELAAAALAAAAPYSWDRTARSLLDFYETLL